MKKLFLYVFLVLMFCNVGFAEPMWKISDNWICNPKLHTKIKLDGTVVGINELAITQIIDFKNSKIISSSESNESIGKIIKKFYVTNPNKYVENILIIDWKGWGKYSKVITHDLITDEYWNWKSSGMSRGTIYSSFSKCKPL